MAAEGSATDSNDDDEDDMENWLSVAAIEAELKPKVLATFDNIADVFKRLRRLQQLDIQGKLKNETLSPAQERTSKKLKEDIVREVKSLSLNQSRIDDLVGQLYDINKRLIGNEGRLMRLAESHGVAREGFPQALFRLGTRSALARPRVGNRDQGLEEFRRQG